MDKNLQISKEKSLIQKTLKLKLYKKFLIRNHYQNVKINGIIFIMKKFHWPKILTNLKRQDISNTIKEFQWEKYDVWVQYGG